MEDNASVDEDDLEDSTETASVIIGPPCNRPPSRSLIRSPIMSHIAAASRRSLVSGRASSTSSQTPKTTSRQRPSPSHDHARFHPHVAPVVNVVLVCLRPIVGAGFSAALWEMSDCAVVIHR